MMKTFVVLCVIFFAYSVKAKDTKEAVAVLRSDGDSGVTGTVTFTQKGGSVLIEGTITGLTPGKHGFHVHEKGDVSNGCAATGSHFNPHNATHGGPSDPNRHVGDLGNILANDGKEAHFIISDSVITLEEGVNCILNRAIVVHAGTDDFGKGNQDDSLTTGHAGGRLACGTIEPKGGAVQVTFTFLVFLGTFANFFV